MHATWCKMIKLHEIWFANEFAFVFACCSSIGIYSANHWELAWHNSEFTYHKSHTFQLKVKWNGKWERKKSLKQNTNRIYFWFIWINNYNGIYWHKSIEWETADEAVWRDAVYIKYIKTNPSNGSICLRKSNEPLQ